MANYRRSHVPGGTFFFTLTLADRRSRILTDHIPGLRNAFRKVHREQPFQIEAIVILPEHLHTIWTLPENDTDFSSRWRSIKSRFTRYVVKQGIPLRQNQKGEYDLWQRRFWEHTIRDEADMQRHVDYIHFNPVKHGLVGRACEWPYSSFHRYVRLGWLRPDWAAPTVEEDDVGHGE